ncbi:MAG: hypothetical protein U5J82_14375, partial [Desulfobacterales bacterium]|nr:hypothetical protein [Desulfobacterales bacterium]
MPKVISGPFRSDGNEEEILAGETGCSAQPATTLDACTSGAHTKQAVRGWAAVGAERLENSKNGENPLVKTGKATSKS